MSYAEALATEHLERRQRLFGECPDKEESFDHTVRVGVSVAPQQHSYIVSAPVMEPMEHLVFGASQLKSGEEIAADVACRTGVSILNILSDSRVQRISRARNELCYLLYNRLGKNTSEIGRLIGRDHTTVLSSIRAHEKVIAKRERWNKLAKAIAVKNKMEVEFLLDNRHRGTDSGPRYELCYIMRNEMDMVPSEIARELGMDRQAVGYAIRKHGEKIADE